LPDPATSATGRTCRLSLTLKGVAATETRRLPLYAAGAIEVPFVMAGHRELLSRDTSWEDHSHPTHELLWNEGGTSNATIGSRLYTITPTIGLWIPAGMPHSGWSPAGTRQRAAQFSVTEVPSISDDPVAVDVSPLLRLLLDRIDDAALDGNSRAAAEAVVLDLLAPAPRELLLRMPTSPILEPIVAAILRDPADATTLVEWAERLGVSTRTITRQFTAETGLGFARWIATARAQHAISILADGSGIDDVAARTGYRSASAFGTAFRRVTGMSPGRFRAM
jgi:AraC-like DNA-binding protein